MIASLGRWLLAAVLLAGAASAFAQTSPMPDPEFAKMAARRAAADSTKPRAETESPGGAISAPLSVTPQSLVQPYGTWRMEPPPVLFGASTVLDPQRDRLVVACGSNGYLQKDVWTLSLAPGSTWQRDSLASAQSPGPLAYAATVYDPVHARLVMFGGLGYPAVPSNRVWTLSLGDPMVWSALPVEGIPPSPRWNMVAAYDSRRNRMIVYGGEDGHAYKSDAWALDLGDTARWERLTPVDSIPAARSEAAGVYDPVRDRLLVYGGMIVTDKGYLDGSWDLLQLSLGDSMAWRRIDAAGTDHPYDALSPAAVYDPIGQRMFLFGGERNGTVPYVLDLSGAPSWSGLWTAREPLRRQRFTALYDASRERVLITGGTESGLDESDVEVLPLSGDPKWSSLGLHPRAPGRSDAITMFDSRRDRMIVFGGEVQSPPANDTWAMSLANLGSWTRLSSTKFPRTLDQHVAGAYDSKGDRCFLLVETGRGDWYDFSIRNELLVLSLSDTSATWQPFATVGDPMPARHAPSMIYDPVRNRLVVFGGSPVSFDAPYLSFNDVWALSLDGTPQWTKVSVPGPAPTGRERCWAFYDPTHDSMIIHGGSVSWEPPIHGPHGYGYGIWYPRGPNPEDEWWSLSLSGESVWRQLHPQGSAPPSLRGESIAYDSAHRRLLVQGGMSGFFGHYNVSTWGLNLEPELRWEYLLTSGDPATARAYGNSVYDPVGDRLVVFGGDGLVGRKNDVWALEFSNGPAAAAWLVRSSVENGNVNLLWGCRDGQGTIATVYRKTDGTSWAAVTSVQADAAGEIAFTDTPPQDHWRQTYRLGITQGGVTTYSAPLEVQLQQTRQPTLAGAYPNPSHTGDFQIRFQLPSPTPARLEMIDARGRVVWRGDVSASTPGIETVRVPARSRSGVYLLRLSQDGKAATLKAVVLE